MHHACLATQLPNTLCLCQGFGEDDYIILDCPGQIELFTHIPVLRTLIDYMKSGGWNVCAVYCLDSHFITDSSKFIAGCFQAMSAMVALEVPHLNVLTKVDLMPDKVPSRLVKSGIRIPCLLYTSPSPRD